MEIERLAVDSRHQIPPRRPARRRMQMNLRLRKLLAERIELAQQGRRALRSDQKMQALALILAPAAAKDER